MVKVAQFCRGELLFREIGNQILKGFLMGIFIVIQSSRSGETVILWGFPDDIFRSRDFDKDNPQIDRIFLFGAFREEIEPYILVHMAIDFRVIRVRAKFFRLRSGKNPVYIDIKLLRIRQGVAKELFHESLLGSD